MCHEFAECQYGIYIVWFVADVFLISREVEQSLAQHETSKCLEWCYDNRSKLRKLKSTMEFNLRIQEFVELVKADKRMDAVRFVNP
jgi:macrophage erythroblast attacher